MGNTPNEAVMEKHNKLLTLALIIALILLSVTGYGLFYISTHQNDVEQRLKNQLANDVSRIKPVNGQAGQMGLQGDRGLQGYPGPKGDTGAQGVSGVQGSTGAQGPQGIQGEQGPSGGIGPQGEPGANGRETEFRCNPANYNYEWRYVGDDNWHIIEQNSNACKSSPL